MVGGSSPPLGAFGSISVTIDVYKYILCEVHKANVKLYYISQYMPSSDTTVGWLHNETEKFEPYLSYQNNSNKWLFNSRRWAIAAFKRAMPNTKLIDDTK